MDVKIIKEPDVIDAMVEADKRGLGKLASNGFVSGALRACGFPSIEPNSARAKKWDTQGFDWATIEIDRRGSAGC